MFSGAFVLLPKFAYDDEDLKKSYWIKQYSPEVLGEEDSGHAAAATNSPRSCPRPASHEAKGALRSSSVSQV